MAARAGGRKGALVLLAALALLASLVAGALRGCGGGQGWGPVFKSAADRLLPTPRRTVWAPCPDPDSYSDWYPDASGTGTNYVYDVGAATEEGTCMTVTIVLFGRKASGQGWLEIDAKGTSGVHYDSVEEGAVPHAAREALGVG